MAKTLKKKQITVLEKPNGYEEDLSGYKPIYSERGVDFAWGFEILRHLGDERFNALGQYGELVHLGDYYSGRWAVIVKQLDNAQAIEAAIEKYGEISKVTTGPKGGFRSVTFGTREFWSDTFSPVSAYGQALIDWRTDPRVEIQK